MRGGLGGPRVLLGRVRKIMAAEVCSVYVLRFDATLELYATDGLNPEAVHQTVMRSDEGLVGLVATEANVVNLSDAHAHPAFSFRPETGEEIYHSFLGVPILRAGNTLGVLVVQNRARRRCGCWRGCGSSSACTTGPSSNALAATTRPAS